MYPPQAQGTTDDDSPQRADMSSVLPPLRLENRHPQSGAGRPQALEPPSGPSSGAPVHWTTPASAPSGQRPLYAAEHWSQEQELGGPSAARYASDAPVQRQQSGSSPQASGSRLAGQQQQQTSRGPVSFPQSRNLRIRQQPEVARACGFGERDRRVIDPPPILELELSPEELAQDDEESPDIQLPVYVVHASLWNEDGSEDVTTFVQPSKKAARRLVGTLVASGTIARDQNQRKGCFFTFADLSCRTNGRYRLRFNLVRIDPSNMRPGISSPMLANLMSDVFTVYSPKDFPGMRRSTPLTQALKNQGVSVPAKKSKLSGPSQPQAEE